MLCRLDGAWRVAGGYSLERRLLSMAVVVVVYIVLCCLLVNEGEEDGGCTYGLAVVLFLRWVSEER